ncbi:MAG: flagellar protein FlgN [Myxococcota bacterium]
MSPSIQPLIAVLDQETSLLKELVELLQGDQQRIIRQDVEALEESNRHKEAVVLRFQKLERSRLSLTQELGVALGLASEDMRISRICPLLGPQGRELQAAAEKLRALVGSFQELVVIGRGFLEQSIVGIRGLLALIQSLRTPQPQTYGATGRFEPTGESQAVAVRREV